MIWFLSACVATLPSFQGPAKPTAETGPATGDTATTPGETGTTETGTDTGPPTATADTGQPAVCTFSEVATGDVGWNQFVPFDLVASVAPLGDLDGDGRAELLYIDHGGVVQLRTVDGAGQVQTAPRAIAFDPQNDVAQWLQVHHAAGGTYLVAHSFNHIFVIDAQRINAFLHDLRHNGCQNGGDSVQFDTLITDGFWSSAAGPTMLAGCTGSSGRSSLWAWDLGVATPTRQELVRFTFDVSGRVASVPHTLAARASGSGPQVWAGDAGDAPYAGYGTSSATADTGPEFYEPTRVFLLGSTASDLELTSLNQARLTVTGAPQPITSPDFPQPLSVDVDGDGSEDLVAMMPAEGGGVGEIWVLLDIDNRPNGAELTSVDMAYRIVPGADYERIMGITALVHPAGPPTFAVAARERKGAHRVALVPLLPRTAGKSTYTLGELTTSSIGLPPSADGPAFDLQPAGDVDGDACTDLVIQVQEVSAPFFGQGQAIVVPGR